MSASQNESSLLDLSAEALHSERLLSYQLFRIVSPDIQSV